MHIMIIQTDMQINDNQQLCTLNNEQLQLFLSGRFGDGCITTSNTNSTYYTTNCKFKEYIMFKSNLLGSMSKRIGYTPSNGYSKTPIYTLRSCSSKVLDVIKKLRYEDILPLLDNLGLALWFYDDISLHKTNLFYNLNTQALPKEFQENCLIPYFNKLEIYPKLQIERKKDGRVFWYLRIAKYEGASKISELMSHLNINCYNYKLWSSETIQKWSKLQEQLKSQNKIPSDYYPYQLGCMMREVVL